MFRRDIVWGVITGLVQDCASSGVLQEVREIETWILRLLSAPVPVPGRTKVEVHMCLIVRLALYIVCNLIFIMCSCNCSTTKFT